MVFNILLIVTALVILMWVGYRLLKKPNEKPGTNRQDIIFDELKSLHKLKVNLVPAKLLYSKTIGMGILFYTYFCLLGGLSGVLDYVTRGSSSDFDLSSLVIIFGYACFVGLFYLIGILGLSGYYNLFKYGVAPNMQYGKPILLYLADLGKKIWKWHFILYGVIYIALRIFSGHGVISVFVTTFIFIPGVIIYLNMEVSRIGIPNLLNTFKNLIKANKASS